MESFTSELRRFGLEEIKKRRKQREETGEVAYTVRATMKSEGEEEEEESLDRMEMRRSSGRVSNGSGRLSGGARDNRVLFLPFMIGNFNYGWILNGKALNVDAGLVEKQSPSLGRQVNKEKGMRAGQVSTGILIRVFIELGKWKGHFFLKKNSLFFIFTIKQIKK